MANEIAADDAGVDIYVQCGVKFDPDLPQTLRLEFARSNTKMTKPRQLFSPAHATVHPAFTSAAAYIHPFTTTR
jgi:hypothetical protein